MTCNNPNLDIINMDVKNQYGKILLICSQDIARKRNFGINQGP